MVTLYRENLLANAEQHDPADLAIAFVATLKGDHFPEYQPSGSWRVDDQYIWWLADSSGMNSTWDPGDWPALIDALGELMDSDESARRTVLDFSPISSKD